MFKKNIYLATALSIFSIATAFAAKVEVQIQLQVGNRVGESVVIVDSEEYTQLSMDNESLGFAIKLANAKKDHEIFETIPTHNETPIANFFRSGKQTTLGAGCTLNGYTIEKDLIITFLSVKHLP